MPAQHPARDEPWPDDPEQIRWGVYLRPNAAMGRAQAEIHDLLERQFGLRAAGTFMPHATLKGFFRSDASAADLIVALGPVLRDRPIFPVHNLGVTPYARHAIVLDVNHTPGRERNLAIQALHTAVLNGLAPMIHPDCSFSRREGTGNRFSAHLTLMMADCPDDRFNEVLAFVQELTPIGPPVFVAEWVHLYEFTSAAWSGNWWETLRWRLHHSWQLGSEPAAGNSADP